MMPAFVRVMNNFVRDIEYGKCPASKAILGDTHAAFAPHEPAGYSISFLTVCIEMHLLLVSLN